MPTVRVTSPAPNSNSSLEDNQVFFPLTSLISNSIQIPHWKIIKQNQKKVLLSTLDSNSSLEDNQVAAFDPKFLIEAYSNSSLEDNQGEFIKKLEETR